ncbi:uPF0374 protein HMPREF9962_1974 [Coprobacillus sp. CAG:826]|jgi:protein associated with RNAse G/E|nr:uPF0374 protein HMPREF9962_1974 [Coprobacillus sp. CAG:826]
MDMIEPGMWIQVRSFKHDGLLHRSWDQGLVLEVNDDFIITASKKTRVTESDGRVWYTREPAITFFSKKYWYNVIAMLKEDGVSFYCNIASPSLVDNDVVKYIDYDLDLKLYPTGTIKILDEREYEHHKEKYKYGDKLDFILKRETQHIFNMMKKGMFPFQLECVQSYYERFLKYFEEQHRITGLKKEGTK